jgi:methylmalonyl-CoA mutase cobalamin-binding domain/chain
MTNDLQSAVLELRRDDAKQIVENLLSKETDPVLLLRDYRAGMEQVMHRYEQREIFLQSVVAAANMHKSLWSMLEPVVPIEQRATVGTIVIGTVQNDIHDQGKNMTTDLLRAIGFEVHDLGVDVPPDEFVAAVQSTGADILGLSGLITASFQSMKATIKAVREAGLAPRTVIGGGLADETLRSYTAADAETDDMVRGARICQAFLAGISSKSEESER